MDLQGKKILITGGTGSLGVALIRRLKDQNVDITVFSRDETKQSQLRAQYPQYRYLLGDISRVDDLRRAFRGIDVVFHFAAYKQVPAAQNNVRATMQTNIIGSQNVVDAAIDCGVSRVVASSTDKASQPVNFYGVSKAAMESLFQDANKYGSTTFHLSRYGNVICSNQSVIPLFIRQLNGGGPITVTDKRMTRFWITLDRALDLVFLALNVKPGVIVVPKAGAASVLRIAELIADGRVNITETKIRPGEKIHESMVSVAESFHTTQDIDNFYIYPATEGHLFTEYIEPFEYTSNGANTPQLTNAQINDMISAYYKDYEK